MDARKKRAEVLIAILVVIGISIGAEKGGCLLTELMPKNS